MTESRNIRPPHEIVLLFQYSFQVENYLKFYFKFGDAWKMSGQMFYFKSVILQQLISLTIWKMREIANGSIRRKTKKKEIEVEACS
jgi:hypothetical protein